MSAKRVLIIDDDWSIRYSLALYLKKLGYEPMQAESGEQALSFFQEDWIEPDLVLLDLNMGGMSGQELLSALKEEASRLPFVIISGTTQFKDVVEVLRLGAWDYLSKPIMDMELLRHSLERSLERARLLADRRAHKKQLEEEVTRRTEQLQKSNDELLKEIKERRDAEIRLTKAQRRLRRLHSELTQAEERERSRIAQGLHDEVAQNLSVVKLMLQSLRHKMRKELLARDLDQPIVILDEALKEIRTLTFALSPKALLELGLRGALEWRIDRLKERYGLNFDLRCALSVEPIEETGNLVFRVLGELLTNLCKYAQAEQVQISSWREEGQVCIQVEDDGIGFEPSHLERSGFGLVSISERLDYHGGRLILDSAPGAGTRVTLSLPEWAFQKA